MKLAFETTQINVHIDNLSHQEGRKGHISGDFTVVVLETEKELASFEDDGSLKERKPSREALKGKLLDNLVKDLGHYYDQDVRMVYITVDSKAIRTGERSLEDILKSLESKQKNGELPGEPENTGVIIASADLAKTLSKSPFKHTNVIIPNQSSKKKVGIQLPFDTEYKVTISIPAYLWTSVSANVKDDGAGINLLGLIYRAVGCLMNGKTEGSIYSVMRKYHKGLLGKIIMVEDMNTFFSMIKAMKRAKVVSIDTEGTSLKRVGNTLLSLQILTSEEDPNDPNVNPEKFRLWFLPYQHSETPWDSHELKQIKKSLRNYFENFAYQQVHVYANAKFDLHQLFDRIAVRFNSSDVYDIQAGSFSLEEHQRLFNVLGVKSAYALEHMEYRHEYKRPSDLVIAKADRSRMAEFSLKEIAEYGTIDIITPYLIMLEQIKVARERGYPDFLRFITRQIGVMIQAMTQMEHSGVPIDYSYLQELASPIGPLAQQIQDVLNKFMASENVKEANNRLLKGTSFQQQGMFGKVEKPMIYDISKNEHNQLLFFDVMNLEKVKVTKTGEASLDAKFQKIHRHVEEVALYNQYQKLTKLKSSFADAVYKYINTHRDMKGDRRLRPEFTYFLVLTGRSSTVKPSTQQLPQHGKLAKIIKSMFKVTRGRLIGKTDYSAHEVRVSGNISLDENICRAVDTVNKVLFDFRIAKKEEKEAKYKIFKQDGDLHIQNALTFFDVKITKDDPLRQDAKSAVFAVTYGSKENSIGRKMHEEALIQLEDKVLQMNPEDNPKEYKKLRKELEWMYTEDAAEFYLEKATNLLATLRQKWAGLTEYIDNLNEEVAVDHVLFGPHGRPRHLWAHISPDKFARFAMDRRGFNSMSQGFASDIGYTSIYLFDRYKYEMFDREGYKTDIKSTNAVHDSSFKDMAFQFAPVYMYLQEHTMTTLCERYYYKNWKIKPKSHYGFDLELGQVETEMNEWDKRPQDMHLFIEKIGKPLLEKGEIDKHTLRGAIEDAKILGEIRYKELVGDKKGYEFSLERDKVYNRVVPQLACWN